MLKVNYGEGNIEIIDTKKDIKKMNAHMYETENLTDSGYYITDDIVRNVWNVTIIENPYGYKKYYYIDATTGEIIGEDATK